VAGVENDGLAFFELVLKERGQPVYHPLGETPGLFDGLLLDG